MFSRNVQSLTIASGRDRYTAPPSLASLDSNRHRSNVGVAWKLRTAPPLVASPRENVQLMNLGAPPSVMETAPPENERWSSNRQSRTTGLVPLQ